MRRSSVTPTPWWQVGLTVLPGLLVLPRMLSLTSTLSTTQTCVGYLLPSTTV